MPESQDDFQCSQIGDFRGWSGQHKGCRASHTHAIPQPLLKQRNRSASAGVERHADGGRHQYSQCFISAKQGRHGLSRNIPLEQGRQENTDEKIKSCCFHISAHIFQIAHEKTGIGIPALWLFKTSEIKR